jgi:hypothetical protein
MSLTGHIIPDRPDTGAAGWIKQKVVDRNVTKGRTVSQYQIDIECVPNVIMSDEAKERARIQWVVEPQATHNEKKMREAEARYYGGWEVGGSLALSEFSPNIHLIDEFDYKRYKPTYYRMIDHGQTPCAAAVIAVMPWGDAVMVKEYYEYGKNIEDNANGIVEMCGNNRIKVDQYTENGMTWELFDEQNTGMEFASSELDCRSFGRKSEFFQNINIGTMYNQFGCICTPATGTHRKITLPLTKQWFALDKSRQHITDRIGKNPNGELSKYGAPRFYIFRTCSNTISEIARWTGEDKDDHLISCIIFFCARDRMYQGDSDGEVDETEQTSRSSITGY